MSAVENDVSQAAAAKKPKTEYEAVTMSDGRVVQFPKSRSLSKQSFITGVEGYTDATAVRLDFSNGETRLVTIPGAEIVAEVMAASGTETVARLQHLLKAAAHGYEQKLGDEMAYTPKKDEAPPTVGDKIEWVDELISRLQALEWSIAREGGGGLAGAGVLVQALVALSGKTKEEIREFLKPLTKEDRAAMKRASPVKEKIQEIEDEIAKKNGVDGSALVGKLGIAV
jgi:hypothetical protein